MTTTPTPGSPEWLRTVADWKQQAGFDEQAAGLRAAAEEIERLKESELEWAGSSDKYAEKLDVANARIAELEAQLAAPICYRSTTDAYTFEVSPERYAKFSDAVKRWYVPVRAQQDQISNSHTS